MRVEKNLSRQKEDEKYRTGFEIYSSHKFGNQFLDKYKNDKA